MLSALGKRKTVEEGPYYFGFSNSASTLAEQGYVIMYDVCYTETCYQLREAALDILSNGQRHDPKTWCQGNVAPKTHSQLLPLAATLQHESKVDEYLVNSTLNRPSPPVMDLIPPPEWLREPRRFDSGQRNWSRRQPLEQYGFRGVHGYLAMQPMERQDAGVIVLAGSHRHASIDPEWLCRQDGVAEVRIELPQNALLLMDHRLVYTEVAPTRGRKVPRWGMWIYVNAMTKAEEEPTKGRKVSFVQSSR
jgi:hypothetical protein